MRLTFTYSVKTEDVPEQAELYEEKDVAHFIEVLRGLGHDVTPLEVSRPSEDIAQKLVDSRPDLIFNVAEGLEGRDREAYYPSIFRRLGLPFTGGGPSLMHVTLDKRVSEKILALRGVRVPHGALLTRDNPDLPDDFSPPFFVKPNYEGMSKGISEDSIANDRKQAQETIRRLLEEFPAGVNVERYIRGRELTVPMLEASPGHLLPIVEFWTEDDDTNLFDYRTKMSNEKTTREKCPADLTPDQRQEVLTMADKAFYAMPCPDLGRVDLRLTDDNQAYLMEMNPLPSLLPDGALMKSARAKDYDFEEVFALILRSAARRYKIPDAPRISISVPDSGKDRPGVHEAGITIGHYKRGEMNAITDVPDVRVSTTTHIEDDVPLPGGNGERTSIRTGITAIVPEGDRLFNNHLIAGGFILNGIGEMSGLTQAMEWGWLETPICLSDTMSLGMVHTGIVQYMLKHHPDLGRKVDVVIPIIGETNSGFLNDTRLPVNTPEETIKTIENAHDGPVEQGSVGGGTGMVSFDFAGGTGSASRVLPRKLGGYTVGVLVQSNFGKLRNLTIEGDVVGKTLDPLYPLSGRRGTNYGSVIVVIATDAPLMSKQLDRLSKRAALGLGRVGSHAASHSGEIVFAFSTGNHASRTAKEQSRLLNVSFLTDEHINPLYEAVIEATEEAVLNAMFYSAGMDGKKGRVAPPLPTARVLEILRHRYPTPDRHAPTADEKDSPPLYDSK